MNFKIISNKTSIAILVSLKHTVNHLHAISLPALLMEYKPLVASWGWTFKINLNKIVYLSMWKNNIKGIVIMKEVTSEDNKKLNDSRSIFGSGHFAKHAKDQSKYY